MIATAAVLCAGVAVMLGRYAFSLEAVPAGRFAPDLTGPQRRYTTGVITVFGCAAGTATALTVPDRPASAALILAAAAAPAMAFIDIRAWRLPLALSGLLAAAALGAFVVDAFLHGTWPKTRSALGAAVVIGILALSWWWFTRGWFGLGDVALMAVIGLYLGWYALAFAWLGALLALLVAAVVAAVHKIRHRARGSFIPVGPSLLVGWWLTTMLAMTG